MFVIFKINSNFKGRNEFVHFNVYIFINKQKDFENIQIKENKNSYAVSAFISIRK